MDVSFRLLDVFTDRPFAGNQLCVVPETPPDLTSEDMLMLAREIGFSETTFVTALRPDGYDVRIFTPAEELPFAGHPTLGTAFALVAEGLAGSPLVQHCPAGEIPVKVDLAAGTATMRQLPAKFGEPLAARELVAEGAGLAVSDLVDELPIVTVSTGIAHLMVPVRTEAALRRAVRNDAACRDACEAAGAESLYLFTVRGAGDVMARMFDRWSSIGEDPATGSAAGPLGAYLAAHRLAGMPGRVVVAQGELTGRPSLLRVEVAPGDGGWLIDVSGGVRIVGSGTFGLDPGSGEAGRLRAITETEAPSARSR